MTGPLGPLVAILLCFVLPGLTWGPLIAPGRLSDLGRLGRAIGASIIVSALLATVLVWIGRLEPLTTALALLVVTALPLASPRVRSELVESIRVRRRLGPAVVAVAAVSVVVVHLARSHGVLGPESLPATSTVWYYAHLAELVGSSGGLPAQFPEWGGLRPFQTDYLPFTAHSAMAFSLMQVDIVADLEIYRLAILGAAIAIATLLFRRWVPTWVALVGAVLLVTTLRMDWKLLSYKPETFGFVIGLFALWLVDRAAVERSPRLFISSAIAFGVVVMSHAEVAVVLLPAVAGIALVRGVLRPGAGRLGLRIRLGQPAVLSTLIPIVAVVVGTATGLVANAILTGHGGLVDYVTGSGSGPNGAVEIDKALVPDGWVLSDDPTWNFNIAAVAAGQVGTSPPRGFTDRRMLSRENLHVWPALDARTAPGLIVLGVILVAPVLAWPWLGARRRSLLLVVLIFGVGLLAGAWLLTAISDTYVPRRVGGRRLIPYELLVPVGAAMVGILLLAAGLRRAVSGVRLAPARRGVVAAIGVAALIALPLISSTSAADDEESTGITPRGYAAYAWLRDNLPGDARILANAYTDGSLTLLSGRTGILDGRAVYLEDPPFLSEATGLLLGGRRFFGDPSSRGSDEYLADSDVDYLLVGTTPDSGFDLGGYRPFATDLPALAADPRFSLVQELADGSLLLYRLVNAGGAP